MGELMIIEKENKELRITSVELVDIINQFRKVESETVGKECKELKHKSFMEKNKKRIKSIENTRFES